MYIPVVKELNDLLWYLHRRGERRWLQRRVGWWERKRAMGRTRFVFRVAIIWGLWMSLFMTACDYFDKGKFDVTFTVLMVPFYTAVGLFVGRSAWADNERLYARALRGDR
jgi:hypothetical protein